MDNNKKKVDQLRLNIHELTNCRRNSNDDNSALEFISEIVANIIKDWDEPPKQVDSVCVCKWCGNAKKLSAFWNYCPICGQELSQD